MNKHFLHGFSLLELMTVVAIIGILAALGVTSYRDYTIRSSIGALIPAADKVKDEVEDLHNQGTIFGTSVNQIYLANSVADKPVGLNDIVRTNYGCVNIDLDLNALNLDSSSGQSLTITWCPTLDNGAIEWQCGYGATSYSGYIQYLPANCQNNSSTSIQNTSF